MHLTGKLPVEINKISEMMQLLPDEVRMCPYLEEVRNIFKGFNYGGLSKDRLIENLSFLAIKSKHKMYETGIKNAIAVIKTCY